MHLDLRACEGATLNEAERLHAETCPQCRQLMASLQGPLGKLRWLLRLPRRPPDVDVKALVAIACAAEAKSLKLVDRLWRDERAVTAPLTLRLGECEDRYVLLYSLQRVTSSAARGPLRARRFGETAAWKLSLCAVAPTMEAILPVQLLRANVQILLLSACLWTGELDRGALHQKAARRALRGSADVFDLAVLDYFESQRLSFLKKCGAAKRRAARARRVFLAYGQHHWAARADAAIGLAHALSGDDVSAVTAFDEAARSLKDAGLWDQYAACVGNAAESLVRLGRVDEAQERFRTALAATVPVGTKVHIRANLSGLLSSAGLHREAAHESRRAAELAWREGLLRLWLRSLLDEIQAWLRAGERNQAARRLDALEQGLTAIAQPDPTLVGSFRQAIEGDDPDFELVARLCARTKERVERELTA